MLAQSVDAILSGLLVVVISLLSTRWQVKLLFWGEEWFLFKVDTVMKKSMLVRSELSNSVFLAYINVRTQPLLCYLAQLNFYWLKLSNYLYIFYLK